MNKIQNFLSGSRENCCGCGTCAITCPVEAIEMKPLELGCLYPVVNSVKCISCGKCVQVCAFNQRNPGQSHVLKAFAASATDAKLLRDAASGGVFGTIAHSILQKGGAVFGCALERREGMLSPVHICIQDVSELGKLQGSKYIQSDLGNCFHRVRECLREEIPVLFSGTPCQVDALKHFLKPEETAQLYTIDLVCHGVPSAELFRAYLKHMKKNVTSFQFRSKSSGWGLRGSYTYRRGSAEKKDDLLPSLSSYYSFFLESEIYRESCYACPYANCDRVGDLTIGDFWGIGDVHPEYLIKHGGSLESNKGVSALFVNTGKGLKLLDSCGGGVVLLPTNLKKVVQGNRQLVSPSSHTVLRDSLIKIYNFEGYRGIEKQWKKGLGIRYYFRHTKRILKCLFNHIAKLIIYHKNGL